jgi:hypothetical protein
MFVNKIILYNIIYNIIYKIINAHKLKINQISGAAADERPMHVAEEK